MHSARAIFLEASLATRLCPKGCGSAWEVWHRGAHCAASSLQLLKADQEMAEVEALSTARWPCEDFRALNLPLLPLEQLQKKLPMHLKGAYERQCEVEAGQVGDPAAWPYVPGRSHLLEDRGHCLQEEGLCECFPPWRGASCDQLEGIMSNGYDSRLEHIKIRA